MAATATPVTANNAQSQRWIQYYNPEVVRLFGKVNEAPVVVEGVHILGLLDTGSTISAITDAFCHQYGLKVHPLGNLVKIEGTGGFEVPYIGYVEVNL